MPSSVVVRMVLGSWAGRELGPALGCSSWEQTRPARLQPCKPATALTGRTLNRCRVYSSRCLLASPWGGQGSERSSGGGARCTASPWLLDLLLTAHSLAPRAPSCTLPTSLLHVSLRADLSCSQTQEVGNAPDWEEHRAHGQHPGTRTGAHVSSSGRRSAQLCPPFKHLGRRGLWLSNGLGPVPVAGAVAGQCGARAGSPPGSQPHRGGLDPVPPPMPQGCRCSPSGASRRPATGWCSEFSCSRVLAPVFSSACTGDCCGS